MKALLLFILAVYGWSWLITKSKIFDTVRAWVTVHSSFLKKGKDGKFVSSNRTKTKVFMKAKYLINCIVCTSAWVAVPVALSAGHSMLFNYTPMVVSVLDLALLMGVAMSSTWMIAYMVGDAD